MKKSKLSSLFYIYSELYVAVLFAGFALLELLCGFALLSMNVPSISFIAFGGFALFSIIAISFVASVYLKEKAN
jgi:hypothetical protein